MVLMCIHEKIFLCGFMMAAIVSSPLYAQEVESGKETSTCGIENCHGVDIACGSNVPEACTAMYALGDFCRQYARCEEIKGECRFVPNKEFDVCKSCVEQCGQQFQQDPAGAFDCEGKCRDLL